MDSKPIHGLLVLADISGFTSFMASAELEHAHDILSELLELLVASLTPNFSLVEIEGDAVYVCAPESALSSGESLLEIFESTYARFRDRVQAIRRQTTCECNACRLIPTLDLKFITTCGDYVLQRIAGVTKPVGSDVNLAHRLAKNHVTESTGWRGYALFTQTTLEHMRISPDNMYRCTESYEHLGEVTTFTLDLSSRYNAMVEARRVYISKQQADWSLTVDIAAAPAFVWDYMNDAHKRMQWDAHEIKTDPYVGQRGVGTRNHCIHGKDNERLQTIVDWRPFDYFTFEDRPPSANKPDLLITQELTPTPQGTRLNVNIKLLAPVPGPVKKTMCSMMMKFAHVEGTYRRLAEVVGRAAHETLEAARS